MDSKILDEVERRIRGILEYIENEAKHENPTPKSISNPPRLQESIYSYMKEVLNKCMGRPHGTTHPKEGFLQAIAYQVPRIVVEDALAAMQQKRCDNLNPDKPTCKLEPYFFATLKNMCKDKFIKTTIQWHFD